MRTGRRRTHGKPLKSLSDKGITVWRQGSQGLPLLTMKIVRSKAPQHLILQILGSKEGCERQVTETKQGAESAL